MVAHIQICGTTTCMICGAEDLIRVCKDKIAAAPAYAVGRWPLQLGRGRMPGACTNAPMVQIGKDFYEDLTTEKLAALIDSFAAGEVPVPGRRMAAFVRGSGGPLTALADLKGGEAHNGSVARAVSPE